MKTKEQILEWLDKQPWKNEFYEDVFKYGKNPNYKPAFDDNLISYAFRFDDVPQEEKVWKKRALDYREWYNSNNKPMSWEEYCEQNPITANDYFINKNCDIFRCDTKARRDFEIDANVMPRNLCEAFVAYMKLIQLRNAWVGDAKTHYKITIAYGSLFISDVLDFSTGLSFPTQEMAYEFLNAFKNLLETAKPLL